MPYQGFSTGEKLTAAQLTENLASWVVCNSAGAVLNSFNVASVGDLGLGQFRPTWATDFATIDYAAFADSDDANSDAAVLVHDIDAYLVGTIDVTYVKHNDSALAEGNRMTFAAFGDQT